MKQFLPLLVLTSALFGTAQALTVKVGDLPLTVESSPKLFTLTDEGIRKAFPSAAGRPDAIFVTEDRKVSVAFEWRDAKLAPAEVDRLLTQYPPVIKAQVPNLKSVKANALPLGNKNWAQFVFTTPGKSDDLRREQLMTSVGGRLLLITVSGNLKDYSRNEAIIKAFEASVRTTD